MSTKFTKCNKCKGNLLPKKDLKTKNWSLICENSKENNCFEIFLNEDYQDVFNELNKWKINEFEIHDFVKLGKNPIKMLGAIFFINNLHLPVYKKRLKAFKTLLKSPFGLGLTKIFTRSKYKYTFIYESLSFIFIAILLVAFSIYLGKINISFLDDYLEESDQWSVVSGQPEEIKEKGIAIEENKNIGPEHNSAETDNKIGNNKTEKDSDNDGLSDKDEIEIHKTDPKKADTDDDGYEDKIELDNGYDPLVPN